MFDPEKFGEAMGEAIRAAVEPLQKQIVGLQKDLEDMAAQLQSEVQAFHTAEPAKVSGDKGERGEKGADGLGLAGAMIDRDGSLLITMTNGEVKSLGKVVGKDGQNGNDGKDGLSLESFDMQYLPESHEITVKAVCQGRSKELRYPAGGIRPAGYWREGTKAKAGEAWVHGGSTFYAIKDNESKPSTNDDAWIIGARAGRDGERGATGKVVSDAPIKLVN